MISFEFSVPSYMLACGEKFLENFGAEEDIIYSCNLFWAGVFTSGVMLDSPWITEV